MDWFLNNEKKIPAGGVRTRFAPSPTGYMHIGNLRTALYAYLIAKHSGGTFILRVEDTDAKRYVEGAKEIVYSTLKNAGLLYDEGPDIGGPCEPYVQSARKPLYRPYAELLCEKGAAYYCFCGQVEHDERDHESLGEVSHVVDPCRELPVAEAKKRIDNGDNYVIRLRVPREGSTTYNDLIYGDITVENKTLDDMVLLKSDGLPTYNFANIIDDHLMGITHVVRGNEYLASAPKYHLVYEALGWKQPLYISVSQIMRDSRHKFSKRAGDPTYEDLLNDGYLPDAVLNYVALLGWSPGGEREIFSLSELCEAFEIKGISKSPALFDKAKLTYFNGEYIRAASAEQFLELATPYILKRSVRKEALREIASLVQPRCELLTAIPDMLAFLETLPDYEPSLFEHKKSKTDTKISLDILRNILPALESLTDWTRDGLYDAQVKLAQAMGLKNAAVMWSVRIAASGTAVTPGGGAEIASILGREETLRRLRFGIDKLEAAV